MTARKIYIIVADETKEILNLVKNSQYNINLITTGVGVKSIIENRQLFSSITLDDVVINVGYAGGYGYNIGDIVLVNAFKLDDRYNKTSGFIPQMFYNNYVIDYYDVKTGGCYTSNFFVMFDKDRMPSEPCVFDMEAYYLKAFVPQLHSLKIVSDNLSFVEYKQSESSLVKDDGIAQSWKRCFDFIIENFVEKSSN